MPLYYVNDHLITEKVIVPEHPLSWDQGSFKEPYDRILIQTTPQATRKTEDGKLESFTRTICAHNCASGTSNALTRISSVQHANSKIHHVTVRTSSDTRHDSDVFVVAIPYNGMIVPMTNQNTDALRIYKYLMLRSEQFNIEHEDANYRRVAYFVVCPKYTYVDSDGWYTDEASLKLTFVQSNRGAKTPAKDMHWTFTNVTVRFGPYGSYKIDYDTNVVPYDSFSLDSINKTPICKTVEPTVLSEDGRPIR